MAEKEEEKASTRACRIPEIVANILEQCDHASTVLKARGVSKTWRNVVDESPALQKKLFWKVDTLESLPESLEPDDLRQMLRLNPLFSPEHRPNPVWMCGVGLSDHDVYLDEMIDWAKPFDALPSKNATLLPEMRNWMPPECWFRHAYWPQLRPIFFCRIGDFPIDKLINAIPATARRAYFAEPALPTKIDIEWRAPFPERGGHATVHAVIELSQPSTLGEYLQICGEVIARQPPLKFSQYVWYNVFSRVRTDIDVSKREMEGWKDLVPNKMLCETLRYTVTVYPFSDGYRDITARKARGLKSKFKAIVKKLKRVLRL